MPKLVEFYPELQGRPESKVAFDLDRRQPSIPSGLVRANMVVPLKLSPSTYDDLQDWINGTQSAGRISGGAITATDVNGGDGTVIIAAGTGFIKMTDSAIGETKFFDWSEETAFALANNSVNYIFVRYRLVNSTPTVTIEKTTDRTTIELNREFALGRVYRAGNATHIVNSGIHLDNFLRLNHERLVQVRGFERGSGGVITEKKKGEPEVGRYLTASAGVFFLGANKVETVLQDTANSHSFTWWYHSSGAWHGATGQEQISNEQYDDGNDLALLTGNRYGVQWVFIHFDSDIQVVCGRGNYTLAQAENAVLPDVPSVVSEFSILAAKIIVQHEGTNFKAVEGAYEQYFPISYPPDHNDLTSMQGGTTDEYYHLTSAEHTEFQTGYVTKALFEAHSIIAAVEDNTPLVLEVAASRILGRKASGNIAAMTVAETLTLLGVESGATADLTGLEIVTLLEALAEGNRLDHGAGLTGLGDDDHTQYILHSLATVENDFLVASGSGAFAKQTLAETLATLSPLTTRGDIMFRNATVSTRLAKGTEGYILTMGADEPAWAAQITHLLAAGATDVTATAAELNVLDGGAWAVGEVLRATGANAMGFGSDLVKLSAPDISGIVSAASALTLPAFTMGADIAAGGNVISALDRQKYSETNLLENGSFEVGDPPTGWTAVRAITAQEGGAGMHPIGSYSMKITSNGIYALAWQGISDWEYYIGRKVTLGAWCYALSGNDKDNVLQIFDGNDFRSISIPKDDTWHWITVTLTVTALASYLRARLYMNATDVSDTDDIVYIDGAIMVEGDSCPAFSPKPIGTYDAITLRQKLTAGAVEIEGSAFDIDGGTIDGVTIGGAVAPTVTNLGAVATCDINGGTIAGVTIDGDLTWSSTQTGVTLTSPDINGTIGTTGLTMPTFTMGGDIVLAGNHISSSGHISILASGDTDDYLYFDSGGHAPSLNSSGAKLYLQRNIANDINMWGGLQGTGRTFTLAPTNADAGNILRDSPTFNLTARYWSGAANVAWHYSIDNDMQTAGGTPKSQVIHSIGGTTVLTFENDNGTVQTILGGVLTLNAQNLVADTTTGTEIATAADQKLGFFGATPVIQQAGVAVSAAGIHAALVNLGLITA